MCIRDRAKLIAPFSPFLAEDIYRNLNSIGKEKWESVHLSMYPNPQEPVYQFIDEALEDRMRMAREVVSLCRSARNEAGLRVRQPLERVIIVISGQRRQDAVGQLEKLILEEINVHNIEFEDDLSQLLEKKATPVFKSLGPKFGAQVNQVAEIIRGFSLSEIDRLENGEKISITVDRGKHGEVEREDVEIVSEARSGLAVQSEGDLTIALDTKLNEDLVSEGLAREFINRVQNMRKSAGFQVTDRINVCYEASSTIHRAIRQKADYIRAEILAVSMIDSFKEGTFNQKLEIEQDKIHVGIEQVQE